MSILNKRWQYKFHTTVRNPTCPSGEVHVYEVFDAETRETVCSIGIDRARHADIAVHLVELHNETVK